MVTVLSRYFVQDGYEIVIVTLWRAQEEYELSGGIKRINLGDLYSGSGGRLAFALKRFLGLRSVIKKEAPDLVISFCNKANFRCAYSLMGMKIPLLVSVRNDPRIDYAPYRRAAGRMERKAAGCVFQTPDARDFFSPPLQKRSCIIWNPLDEKYLSDQRMPAVRGRYIVTVGRISAQKNQLLLLRAFGDIHTKFPDVELRIYGEESEAHVKDELLDYAEKNGLSKKVRFMGQCSSLETEIWDAALFVLSSDYEGMPNALMEAMALGIPVISTDCPCGGARLLIEDGVSGRLVPVGDEKRLAEAALELLGDPEKAERMGENARRIREKASPSRVYEQWKTYAEQLMIRGRE